MKLNFYLKRKNKKWIRVVAVLLAAVLVAAPVIHTPKVDLKADTKSDLADAKADLAAAKKKLKSLQNKAARTEKDLEEAKDLLVKLLRIQNQLEEDIENMSKLIDQNNIDLANAKKKLDEEYESMKLRIQFMYENSTADSVWTAIMSAGNFSDMLNRVEYISQVYKSDRELMDRYEQAVNDVERVSKDLADNMNELVKAQEDYAEQQDSVEQTISILREREDIYATDIAKAKNDKTKYEKSVSKLEEKVRREEAAAAGANADTYDGGGTGAGGIGKDSPNYLKDDKLDPEYKTDIKGTDLVKYAMKFVGNHYVWAGNDPTCTDWNCGSHGKKIGVDCSGFVKYVYKHFGISTVRYSQSFKTEGQAVGLKNIKPGDVVVYPGHVAIYAGDGKIVEAQGSKKGITCTRRVDCHTITAVRRLL